MIKSGWSIEKAEDESCKEHPGDTLETKPDDDLHHHNDHNDHDHDHDDGYPAYSHQSYSHQVVICHNDEGWEYDTVKFPPYPYKMMYNDVVRLYEWNPTPHKPQLPPEELPTV